MADEKLVELPALTVILPDDLLYVVDVHDTTDDPTGSSKQITVTNLLTGYAQLAAANTFTVAPQTIISDADVHKGLIVQGNSATQSANLQEWQTSVGGFVAGVGADGHAAFGNASAVNDASLLFPGTRYSNAVTVEEDIDYDWPADLVQFTGGLVFVNLNPSNALPATPTYVFGLDVEIQTDASSVRDVSNLELYGIFSQTNHGAATHLFAMIGSENYVNNFGAGHVDYAAGYYGGYDQSGAGLTDEAYGASLQIDCFAGSITVAKGIYLYVDGTTPGTIGTAYGIHIDSAAGITTAAYGLYVSDQSGAGSSIAENIHSAGASSVNTFEGQVVVGSFKMASGAGLTKVLTSDAQGVGTWQTAAAGSGTVTSITLTQPAAGLTITGSGVAITTTGTPTFALADDLAAVEGLSTNGLAARTTTSTWATRTITGTTNVIAVTNGDGVAGNPTLTIDSGYVGQTSIVTLGTVATGTWNATIISTAKGGTGVDNSTGGTANQFWARPDNATGAAAYRLQLPRDLPHVVTALSDGSTVTVDWSVGKIFDIAALTASRTIAFSNDYNGGSVVLRFASGGTGAFTPVWPAGMKWQGGVAPTLSNTSGKYDLVSVVRLGSADYMGSIAPNYS